MRVRSSVAPRRTDVDRLALAEIERGLDLTVAIARDGEEVADVARARRGEDAIEPALARGDGDARAVSELRRDERGAVERVGADVAVRALRERARLDADETAEAASVLGAERAGDEVDARDEIGVDDGAKTAAVIERGDVDAVDVDARVARRRAPHDDLTGRDGRARNAGEVLDHLEDVALRAGDLLGLLGADGGLVRFATGLGPAADFDGVGRGGSGSGSGSGSGRESGSGHGSGHGHGHGHGGGSGRGDVLEDERVAVGDLGRRRLVVDLGGLEDELARGGDGGGVEVRPRGLGDGDVGDRAGGARSRW